LFELKRAAARPTDFDDIAKLTQLQNLRKNRE